METSDVDNPGLAPAGGSDARQTRWMCNLILGLAAVVQLTRILQVASPTGEVPFFSANDRSRWCTIAALAVTGSYEVDEVLEIRDPNTRRRTWYTIDLVRHRGADGKQHFYSSKPPLLPTLYTAVYVAIRAVTGSTLMGDPFFVARTMLVIVNLLPLVAGWWLFRRWLDQEQLASWATIVLIALIAWGTFLSTFVSTLNNHLPAALAVAVSLWCVDRIACKHDRRWQWFALCGLGTSFGAANELPALSWVAAAGAILIVIDWRRALAAYVSALLPVALAFFAANYFAHGTFSLAYAHRSLGDKLFEFEAAPDLPLDQLPVTRVVDELRSHGIQCSASAKIEAARRPGVYEFWDAENDLRIGLRRESAADKADHVGVYEWGDWYDYPGSYWTSDRKQGVDRGEPHRGIYIFHALLGHHGIFSLTPFWLVSLGGVIVLWKARTTSNLFADHRLLVTAAITATCVVAIAFYLARPLEDRNYGGVSSGFRWSFWLTPFFVWLAVPVMRVLQATWLRRVVEALVLASVFSACFPWTNPWTSPWLMQYWQYLGWISVP